MLHTAAGHHDGWVCGYTLGDMPGAAVERSYCFQVSAASQCHDMYIIEHVLVARRCYHSGFGLDKVLQSRSVATAPRPSAAAPSPRWWPLRGATCGPPTPVAASGALLGSSCKAVPALNALGVDGLELGRCSSGAASDSASH